MLSIAASRAVRGILYACLLALVIVPSTALRAQNGGPAAAAGPAAGLPPLTPNYDAAAQWTTQKVSKLVFDTSVTPRWLENSDRFWYTYQTREGRRFFIVDPVKKTKAPLFDHAKMAAALTSITRIPYDAQHLPFTRCGSSKNDTAFEFEVQVPRDAEHQLRRSRRSIDDRAAGGAGAAGSERRAVDMDDQPQQGQRGQAGRRRGALPGAAARTKTLHFEYDMATGKVTLNEDYTEEPRRRRWALGLARRQDDPLRAQPQPVHDGRGELREGAEERQRHHDRRNAAHHGRRGALQLRRAAAAPASRRAAATAAATAAAAKKASSSSRSSARKRTRRTSRVRAGNVVWSQDSSKFALVRRDSRKVKDLWVINSLAQAAADARDLPVRDARRGEHPAGRDVRVRHRDARAACKVKADRFKDQTHRCTIATRAGWRTVRGGDAGGGPQAADSRAVAERLAGQAVLHAQSRDMHKLDICVADTTTGEVKTLVEERSTPTSRSKPLRLVEQRARS